MKECKQLQAVWYTCRKWADVAELKPMPTTDDLLCRNRRRFGATTTETMRHFFSLFFVLSTVCLFFWMGSAVNQLASAEPIRRTAASVKPLRSTILQFDEDDYFSITVSALSRLRPAYAIANLRLSLKVTNVSDCDTAQVWSGVDACTTFPTATQYTNPFVYGRQAVGNGEVAASLSIPPTCTGPGVLSLCMVDQRCSVSFDVVHSKNIVLTSFAQTAAALPSGMADTITLFPNTTTNDAASMLLPYFCQSESCGDIEAARAVDEGWPAANERQGGDAIDEAVTQLVGMLNRSYLYVNPEAGASECHPFYEAASTPTVVPVAAIVATFNAEKQRWWVRATLQRIATTAGFFMTCIGPSFSLGLTHGEYGGHAAVGMIWMVPPTTSSSSSMSSDSSTESSTSKAPSASSASASSSSHAEEVLQLSPTTLVKGQEERLYVRGLSSNVLADSSARRGAVFRSRDCTSELSSSAVIDADGGSQQTVGLCTTPDDLSSGFYCVETEKQIGTPPFLQVVWALVGAVELVSLFNCTTNAQVNIVNATVASGIPLSSRAILGVRSGFASTSVAPWLSLVGGSTGCREAAGSNAAQEVLRTQGAIQMVNSTSHWFICLQSRDDTLIFTTATPTLTVLPTSLHPTAAAWGVSTAYTLNPTAPNPAESYFVYRAIGVENTLPVSESIVAAACSSPETQAAVPSLRGDVVAADAAPSVYINATTVAAGNGTVILGATLDANNTLVDASMIGMYYLCSPAVRVTAAAASVASSQSTTSATTDTLVTSSTLPQPIAAVLLMAAPDVTVRTSAPFFVNSEICMAASVPGGMYSLIPGEDLSSDAYAAYRVYYPQSSSASSASGSESYQADRRLYLLATTPAAVTRSEADGTNLCAEGPSASSTASSCAETSAPLTLRSTAGLGCLSTADLCPTNTSGLVYVVCAGTPLGYQRAAGVVLELEPHGITPLHVVSGSRTVFSAPSLRLTRFALVTENAADGCASVDGIILENGNNGSTLGYASLPLFSSNSTGDAEVELVSWNGGLTPDAMAAGTYILCYWSLTTAIATSAAVNDNVSAATNIKDYAGRGRWTPVTLIEVHEADFYAISTSALVPSISSGISLFHDLTVDKLLPGFFSSPSCDDPISTTIADWEVEPTTAATSPILVARAEPSLSSLVYLCAVAPINASRIAIPSGGIAVQSSAILLPMSSQTTPLQLCSSVSMFYRNSSHTSWPLLSAAGVSASSLALATGRCCQFSQAVDSASGNTSAVSTLQSTMIANILQYGTQTSAGTVAFLFNTSLLELLQGEVLMDDQPGVVDLAVCAIYETVWPSVEQQCTTVGSVAVGSADSLCSVNTGTLPFLDSLAVTRTNLYDSTFCAYGSAKWGAFIAVIVVASFLWLLLLVLLLLGFAMTRGWIRWLSLWWKQYLYACETAMLSTAPFDPSDAVSTSPPRQRRGAGLSYAVLAELELTEASRREQRRSTGRATFSTIADPPHSDFPIHSPYCNEVAGEEDEGPLSSDNHPIVTMAAPQLTAAAALEPSPLISLPYGHGSVWSSDVVFTREELLALQQYLMFLDRDRIHEYIDMALFPPSEVDPATPIRADASPAAATTSATAATAVGAAASPRPAPPSLSSRLPPSLRLSELRSTLVNEPISQYSGTEAARGYHHVAEDTAAASPPLGRRRAYWSTEATELPDSDEATPLENPLVPANSSANWITSVTPRANVSAADATNAVPSSAAERISNEMSSESHEPLNGA